MAILCRYLDNSFGIGLRCTLDFFDLVLGGGAVATPIDGAWTNRSPKEIRTSSLDLECSQRVLPFLGWDLGRSHVFLLLIRRQDDDVKGVEFRCCE